MCGYRLNPTGTALPGQRLPSHKARWLLILASGRLGWWGDGDTMTCIAGLRMGTHYTDRLDGWEDWYTVHTDRLDWWEDW